ncbi:hypothetical protein Tco_0328481 [Tanacetum coccineum]
MRRSRSLSTIHSNETITLTINNPQQCLETVTLKHNNPYHDKQRVHKHTIVSVNPISGHLVEYGGRFTRAKVAGIDPNYYTVYMTPGGDGFSATHADEREILKLAQFCRPGEAIDLFEGSADRKPRLTGIHLQRQRISLEDERPSFAVRVGTAVECQRTLGYVGDQSVRKQAEDVGVGDTESISYQGSRYTCLDNGTRRACSLLRHTARASYRRVQAQVAHDLIARVTDEGGGEGYVLWGVRSGGGEEVWVGMRICCIASERDGLASEVSTLHSAFRDFKEKMEAQQEAQAQVLYNRVAELEAHVMDVSGRLEGEFYPAYLTALAGRRWLLTHGVQLAMVKCLKSPEYQSILGHALGRAMDFGMQEGLAAGHEHGVVGTPLSAVTAYNPETAEANYLDAVRALEEADFPLVHLLKSKKDSGMDEVLDCFLLDGPLAHLPEAAYLQPCLEQLSVPIYHADVKAVVGETSLSFALLNVHTRAEGAKKHVAALRQLMVDIVSHPLSSQNLLGEARTSAAALSVEDLDTYEDLGSVGLQYLLRA